MTQFPLRKGPSGPPFDIPSEFDTNGTVRTNEDGELEAIPGTIAGQLWYFDGVTWLPTSTGPADGQIARWDEATFDWIFIDLPAGGSIPPLTNTFYVDSDTAVDPVDQDGSIAQPFSTLQAAIDAAADVPVSSFVQRALILVAPSLSPDTPGAGNGFFDTGYAVNLTIKGLGSKPTSNANTNVARIGAITTADPTTRSPVLIFQNLYIDSVSIAQRVSEAQTEVFFYDCHVEGTVTCFETITAIDSTFQAAVSPSINATNCVFGFPNAEQRVYGAVSLTGSPAIPAISGSRIDAITQALLNRTSFDFSAGIPLLDHSTVQGSASLSNQNDNIAPQNLFQANPTAGLYELDVYLVITNPSTLGAGSVQIDATYDDGFAVRTLSSTGVVITAGGFTTLRAIMQLDGTSNVTLATTGIVTPDDLAYQIRAVVRLVEY